MKLAVVGGAGEDFEVWAMLDDPSFNSTPQSRGESFILGAGETLPEALAAARADLEAALADLAVFASDVVAAT